MDSDSFVRQQADYFGQITFNYPDTWAWIAFILTVFLLLFAAYVSTSRIAFFSLSPSDMEKLEEEDNHADEQVLALLNNKDRLLGTFLVANNLVYVSFILLGNYFLQKIIYFGSLGWLRMLGIIVVLAFFLMLFGEIVPRIYATRHSLSFCRLASPVVKFLYKLLRPFSGLLLRSTSLMNKTISKENYNLSMDELSQALELTDKNEISEEHSMLEGIIRFGGETAQEVMTPRLDMVDLDIDTPFSEVVKSVVDNAYSRIPIYKGSRDRMKGILYIKDLLPYLGKDDSFAWQSLIRPPYFVPETKMIDDLLMEFQQQKIHMAIVVDEFGGTSGLITMEDIIEEIVGEINDEYDEDERTYVKLNDNTYIFEGKTLLADFFKIMQIRDDAFEEIEEEADTLAGLVLELKGEFPARHEKLTFGNYQFEVLEMDNRRILKVKVTILTPAQPQSNPQSRHVLV